MIKAVLFDMDGVLIDSIPSALRARIKLLEPYGIDVNQLPDPHNEALRGASAKTLLAVVRDQHGIDIDYDTFSREATELITADLKARHITADPALVVFLEDLRSHGVRCAITTSGVRRSVLNKLRILGIGEYFDVIVTGDEATRHKPHPQPYELTMSQLGLKPEECIVIEDSVPGIRSGLDAGCKVIGFSKFNPHHQPFPNGVTHIEDWSEINFEVIQKEL